MAYVHPPYPPSCLTVVNRETLFPIRRIFCIGRNYAEHALEMGVTPERSKPFFFQKSPDVVVAQHRWQDEVVIDYPPATADLQHEVELVVALGLGGRDIAPEQAERHIFGYAIGLDMTRRDLQTLLKDKRWPWDMAKNFDDSAPIGVVHPMVETGELLQGAMTLSVNGVERQSGDLAQMIWSVNEMIAELSRLVTLAAGDLLLTGTPAGVGPVVPGDRIRATIASLGHLQVTVRQQSTYHADRAG
ncbi:MAG: fumarylacetoacetate hydrolase family protein [Magnetococcales bacterium]|nr:fumarylacetoacetate hydrolase family protein [Magnetococcales bacterium]